MNKREAIVVLKTLQLTFWDTFYIDRLQEIIEWIREIEQ